MNLNYVCFPLNFAGQAIDALSSLSGKFLLGTLTEIVN